VHQNAEEAWLPSNSNTPRSKGKLQHVQSAGEAIDCSTAVFLPGLRWLRQIHPMDHFMIVCVLLVSHPPLFAIPLEQRLNGVFLTLEDYSAKYRL
jgi:hypothetical protein